MASRVLDWHSFWPGWNHIFALDFTSTDGVTAFFIGLIIVAFSFFFIPSLLIGICYLRRVAFYLKSLKGVSEDNVIEKRHTLVQRETEAVTRAHFWNRIVGARLWQEFDETLVEHDGRLYNNIDAGHFFNGSTLARRIVESRLFPTGAAILTGIGVLGTFLGLQLGLAGLNLDGDVAKIQGEIKLLAQSASVAFITSVWGVSSSLILNFIEKYFHGIITRRIHVLQCRIDNIFPRFQPMDVFIDIRADGRESCDALNGLAEQIGSRMQESMDSFSREMTGSMAKNISQAANDISLAIGGTLKKVIEDSLVPSIASMAEISKDLAERQAKGSEDAMSTLLKRFMNEMGREGEGQREAMRSAADEIQNAMAGLSGSMEEFFQSLKEQQSNFGHEQDRRSEMLEQSVQKLVAHQGEAMSETNRKIADMLQAFTESLGQEQTRQAESLTSASGNVREAIEDLTGGMRDFFTSLENRQKFMIAEQDERTRTLETAVQRLIQTQDDAQSEANRKVAEMLRDFLDKMGTSQKIQASSLENVSGNVRGTINDLGEQINSFLETMDKIQSKISDEQDSRSRNLEELVKDTVLASKEILNQGQALQSHVGDSQKAMDSVVSRMNKTGDALAEATINLKTLGSEIGQSVGRAANSIERSVSIAEKQFADNSMVAQDLEMTLQSLENMRSSISDATENIVRASTESKQSYAALAGHYRNVQQSMQDHIESLENQIANLLKEYSDHVHGQIVSRMTAWDSQTENFCKNMTTAVQAIGEVVENIDMRSDRS